MVNLLEQQKGKGKNVPEQIEGTQKKIDELNERTRLLEERVKTIREKVHVVNQTALSNVKEINEVNTNQNSKLAELKKDIEEVKNILRKVVKEMSSKAKEGDVKVLEKYINMIDAARFISEKDVERIVDERIKDLKK